MGHSEDDAVHKIPHKTKMHWQNRLKISVLVKFKISTELDIKRKMLYLSNAPLHIFIVQVLNLYAPALFQDYHRYTKFHPCMTLKLVDMTMGCSHGVFKKVLDSHYSFSVFNSLDTH